MTLLRLHANLITQGCMRTRHCSNCRDQRRSCGRQLICSADRRLVLFSPSSKAAEQFADLRLDLLHGGFIHIELHLALRNPLVNQRRKLLHELMSKRVDRGVHIGSEFLNVELVIGIVAVRHTGFKLNLMLRHQSFGIESIHNHSPFLRRVRRVR